MSCCVTSPPYLQQRTYDGSQDIEWPDGWIGQLGNEDTSEKYIRNLGTISGMIKGTMRVDGVFWLNLGDKYLRKELLALPYLAAQELNKYGWKLRAIVPWYKPDAMPENTKLGRPMLSHEYFLQFVLSDSYYYDDFGEMRNNHPWRTGDFCMDSLDSINEYCSTIMSNIREIKRNYGVLRDKEMMMFLYGHSRFRGGHFAGYPVNMIKTLIESSSPRHICSECNLPYNHVMERKKLKAKTDRGTDDKQVSGRHDSLNTRTRTIIKRPYKYVDRGYSPQCDCEAETKKSIILDPFMGSFTTALGAEQCGRDWIGFEISKAYCNLGKERLAEYRNSVKQVVDQKKLTKLDDFHPP